jgi:hypothetical protein
MRDIWGVPPGGFEATAKKSRKGIKAAIAGGLVVLLGVGIGTVVRSMNSSTGVSSDTALAEFRAGKASANSADSQPADDHESRAKKKRSTAGQDRAGSGAAATVQDQGGSAPVEAAGTTTTQNDSDANQTSGGDNATQQNSIGPPLEGVYSWEIEGYEDAPGVHRQLPRRSSRVITHEGDNNWTEHHIFSEQRELWFGLGISQDGVFTRQVRNRVEMGPVEVDKTIVYDPPMFVSQFPMTVNETWDGTWKGKTSGEYQAKCFEHGWLTIGGERVEVWATEVKMQMRGDVEGSATVRSWVSPENRMVVKQYMDTRVTTGPGEYHSEWTGQVLSLHPKT